MNMAAQQPRGIQRPVGAALPDMADTGYDAGEWAPPSNLAAPPPRDGMGQRWVRTAVQGTDDVTNVAKAMNEGWTPRRADSLPDNFSAPTIKHGQFDGVIGIHGMILMEMPLSRIEGRKRYIQGRTDMLMEAVNNDLNRVEDRRMPIKREGKLSTSRGKPKGSSIVMDDD